MTRPMQLPHSPNAATSTRGLHVPTAHSKRQPPVPVQAEGPLIITLKRCQGPGTGLVLVGTIKSDFSCEGSQRKRTSQSGTTDWDSALGRASGEHRRGIDGAQVVQRSMYHMDGSDHGGPSRISRRRCCGNPDDRGQVKRATPKVCCTSLPLGQRLVNACSCSLLPMLWS